MPGYTTSLVQSGPPHSSIVFKECFRSVGGNHKQSTSIVSAMVVPILARITRINGHTALLLWFLLQFQYVDRLQF
jgi:hypothetical protein